MQSCENTVLLVEDNPDDVILFKRACAAANASCSYQFVTSGKEAIDYLKGAGHYAQRDLYPQPGLIVLDIKLPDISGFEVLRWIRSDPVVQFIPVVVFSNSSVEEDLDEAYAQLANGFVEKPLNRKEFTEVVQSLEQFWMRKNRLPRRHRPSSRTGTIIDVE